LQPAARRFLIAGSDILAIGGTLSSLICFCNRTRFYGRIKGWQTSRILPMRWLMIALFVSVAALLIASAGVARHVWRKHKQAEQAQAPHSTEEEIHTEEGK
jgi:hypothetical protein